MGDLKKYAYSTYGSTDIPPGSPTEVSSQLGASFMVTCPPGCDGDNATFLVHVVVVDDDVDDDDDDGDDDDDDDDDDDCFHSDTFWPTALENPGPKAFQRNMPAKKQRAH